jgi:hypothetical protein
MPVTCQHCGESFGARRPWGRFCIMPAVTHPVVEGQGSSALNMVHESSGIRTPPMQSTAPPRLRIWCRPERVPRRKNR